MKQTQSGRTMVEILGILAVMGIFTVVGMQLYAKAMNTIRVNHLMEKVYLMANEVRNQKVENRHKNMVALPSVENTLSYGFSFDGTPTISADKKKIEIKVKGPFTSKICDLLDKKKSDYEEDGLSAIDGCSGEAQTITFSINSSLKKVASRSSGSSGSLGSSTSTSAVDPTSGCMAGGYYSTDGECKKVEPGYFATGGIKKLCPNGKVSGLGYSECSVCPEGSYEADNHQVCKECEAGNYCTSGLKRVCPDGTISANGANSCGPCGEGSYASADHRECKVCEAGFYCTGGIKKTCGSGKVSLAGSTSCSTCDITKYASDDHTECKTCEAGFYCTGGTKKTCGNGQTSGSGQSSCSTCADGTYASNDHKECKTCEAGSYCTNGVSNPCPDGKTSVVGASSCVCSDGTYASGNSCATCTAGYYCTGGVETACGTGQTSPAGASSCTTCPNGQYASGNSCVTCTAGYYCTGGVIEQCSGNTISASGVGSCTACTGGKIASTNHTACLSCDEYHIIGESACETCSDGKKPNANKTACVDCSDGELCAGCYTNHKYNNLNWHKYWHKGRGVCVQCIASDDLCSHDFGFYCVKNSCCTAGREGNYAQSSSNCSPMPIDEGYYWGGTGWTRTQCEAGYYCTGGVRTQCSGNKISARGASSCSACTGGKIASTNHTVCLSCDDNQIAGESACVDCDIGKQPNAAKTACVNCSNLQICQSCVKYRSYNVENHTHKYWHAGHRVCVQCPGTQPDICSTSAGFYCQNNSCCRSGYTGNYKDQYSNCSQK